MPEPSCLDGLDRVEMFGSLLTLDDDAFGIGALELAAPFGASSPLLAAGYFRALSVDHRSG